MKNNKVSIVIPCYNDGKYLLEAIESVEKCDKNLYELIIVDDGSTDKFTIDLMKTLKKKGYIVYMIKHKGQSAARNFGVKKSKFDYLLFLDADNKIYPEYITEGIRILDKNPEIGVVYGDIKVFGLENYIKVQSNFDRALSIFVNHPDICAVVRRSLWKDCKGFDKNLFFWEDWEFFINAYKNQWKFHHIKKVLFEYRLKRVSVNTQRFKRKNRIYALDYVYKKHLSFIIDAIDEIITRYGSIKNLYVSKNIYDQHINQLTVKNIGLEKNLDLLKRELSFVQKELNSKSDELKSKIYELNYIKNTLTWRSLESYQKFIDSFFPINTKIRNKYDGLIIFLKKTIK